MRKLLLAAALSLFASASFAQQVTTPPIVALACAYNSATQTGTSGQFMYVQCDVNGKLVTSGSAPTGAAGGVLSGTYPNPTFANGYFNTATPFNTAIGSAAGNPGVISGVDNSSFGYQAGKQITSGTDNTFLGFQAGNTVATGDNLIMIGSKPLAFSTNGGSHNIGIGKFAFTATVTGNNNIGIGNQPFAGLTSGTGHIAIGQATLGGITTSTAGHVAIGAQALHALTSGGGTVAIGSGAGQVLTTGGQNVILGFQALRNSVDATNTVAIGYNALFTYVSGAAFNQNSIAIGTNTLFASTSGSENVAIGTSAIGIATGGTLNVAVGVQSLQAMTSADGNTAIGTTALGAVTTGSRNVGVGVATGALIDGNDLTTGSNNILIGAGAKFGSATQRGYATVIGADAIGVLFDNSITLGRVSGGTIDTTYTGPLTANGTITASGTGQLNVAAMTQSSAAQSGTVCYNSGTGAINYDATLGCLTSTMVEKDGWRDLTPKQALAMVLKMRAGSFTYKKGRGLPDGEQIGLNAEQIASVDDRLVGRRPNGELAGVRYQQASALYPMAIQALQADNDNLRSEIETLKSAVR